MKTRRSQIRKVPCRDVVIRGHVVVTASDRCGALEVLGTESGHEEREEHIGEAQRS